MRDHLNSCIGHCHSESCAVMAIYHYTIIILLISIHFERTNPSPDFRAGGTVTWPRGRPGPRSVYAMFNSLVPSLNSSIATISNVR